MAHFTQVHSAPGKVLLAGGYLVLDRAFTGLVFGLDARIHVLVQPLRTSSGLSLPEIIVKSPQFQDAEWRYGYRENGENGGITVTQLKGHSTAHQSRNKFVETALEYALSYATTLAPGGIGSALITILADSDYYSHGASASHKSPASEGRFVDFHVPLQEAHKTGLGSSAALVTALTAAVVTHYVPPGKLDLTSSEGRFYLHNLAQAAHCSAQGKIGSGFDVAAATYGSCIYRRFSPSVLETVGEVGSKDFQIRLKSVVEDDQGIWDTAVDKAPAKLPSGLVLLMCDVDCGSETVGMVKTVLAWRKANAQDAGQLWASIQRNNEELAHEFQKLSNSSDEADPLRYRTLSEKILAIRALIREMSTKAEVPIEPPASTKLIDRCCEVPGVIGGVVPGAGGFDAIALLVEDKKDVIENLQQMLGEYQVEVDTAVKKIGRVRLLGVKQDDQGLKREDPNDYTTWL